MRSSFVTAVSLPLLFCLIGGALHAERRPKHIPEGFILQWAPDFSDKRSLKDLEFTDREAWKLSTEKGKPALALYRSSKYKPKVQSALSIALLTSHKFGDFVLEAELLQDGAEYAHRDLCLFFGFQDPTHYYYAHFASKTDDRANQVFIVNERPFTKITSKTTAGSKWGKDQFHKVRVQRIGTKIAVWFDDLETPAMLADDKNFGSGMIGLGSYNDTGHFANVRLWAPKAEKLQKTAVFSKK